MTHVLTTISYANAPEFGAQYATIEQIQEGQHGIFVYFNEAKYDGSTKVFKHCVRTYEDGRLTSAQAIEDAKSALQKHAGRSGYYGPMVYTITKPAQVKVVQKDLVTDEAITLFTGSQADCMIYFRQHLQDLSRSDARSSEYAADLVDGSIYTSVTDAYGNVIAHIYSDESSEPTNRYADQLAKSQQLTPKAMYTADDFTEVDNGYFQSADEKFAIQDNLCEYATGHAKDPKSQYENYSVYVSDLGDASDERATNLTSFQAAIDWINSNLHQAEPTI
ncbi:hypothetical protein [Hymenobacter metallicola]|uniref:Uncharacterized protein n=1 Tax=Hymenobacter metallicola TaxID=2563114 RepID=A0A4Z0QLB6_9BACT|nr:hypothetical protein [Hymenobacter metallicola]TGE29841.1 hypothetical protein E5K02_10380 [Hymenobacter metallicola]